MAKFRISGVWKKPDGVITHYALHKVIEEDGIITIEKPKKTSKIDAIALLELPGNTAQTWLWDYNIAKWKIGEDVIVVNGSNGKFLRTIPDTQLKDNLNHLINYRFIIL